MHPNTLVSQVLKSKYFKNDEVLDAQAGRQPSYLWSSIFSSIDLVKEGLYWRVGDRQTINIWIDKWTPCPLFITVHIPNQLRNRDTKVNSLINGDSWTWNRSIINELFINDKAEQICSIPFSNYGAGDRLSWTHIRNEIFLIRSAKHLECAIIKRKWEIF